MAVKLGMCAQATRILLILLNILFLVSTSTVLLLFKLFFCCYNVHGVWALHGCLASIESDQGIIVCLLVF